MTKIITPAFTVPEIEQAIIANETVTFAPGRYFLDRPICLSNLSGRTLLGDNAVLSGAQEEKVTWNEMGNSIYCAQIGTQRKIDGLRIGNTTFIQARYPHATDKDAIWQGSAADALDFAARCAHPETGYFHVMHPGLWGGMHYRIAGRNADGTLALEGGWQNNRFMGLHDEYRFVENLREALGAPGEFFYDCEAGNLLVCSKDMPGENVFIITNPYLIEIESCQDIRMENLIFEDSARTFMAEFEPLLRSDWCIHRGGAVFVQDSTGVSVSSCEMRRIGSNALFFSGNVSECHVRDCFIHDIGASGICFVGKPSCVRFPCMTVDVPSFSPKDIDGIGPKTDEYIRDCSVENCLIRDIGLTEKQTSCVEVSMSARIRISHCTMHTCPRAAVNFSEGTFGGHILEYCDLFDTVRETGDHGSVNGWGRDRFWHAEGIIGEDMKALALRDACETTILRGNRVRCEHGWDIDLDDGCSNYLVEDNLCLCGGLKFREGFMRTARGNRIINNSFHCHVWFENSGDIFENNLVMRPYLPIGMPEGWGSRIDGNILATAEDSTPRPASELQRQSGQDASSLAMNVQFDADLNTLDGRFIAHELYGVTSEHLRALADNCPIDLPSPLPGWATGERMRFDEVEFKGIDNDGEMSAFATPGHHGVIILSIPPHHGWHRAGLRENTAIITVNGTLIENVNHFLSLIESIPEGAPITFTLRNMQNEAFTVETRK